MQNFKISQQITFYLGQLLIQYILYDKKFKITEMKSLAINVRYETQRDIEILNIEIEL